MHKALWWPIYIGPQQQKEPDGYGAGCFTYPIGPCETNPRISFEDITLRNITSTGSLFPAGVIRCNETNPCKNFVFEDVTIKSQFWDALNIGFITEFTEGRASSVKPDPGFKPVGFFDDADNVQAELARNHLFEKLEALSIKSLFNRPTFELFGLLDDEPRLLDEMLGLWKKEME